MRLVRTVVIAAASIVASFQPLRAQSVIWELVNEYPASVLAGDADVFFAEQVKLRSNGKLVIKLIQDAKSGLRTLQQLKAVSDGRYAMANSFGGALGDENALFLLSSLPLVAPSARARANCSTPPVPSMIRPSPSAGRDFSMCRRGRPRASGRHLQSTTRRR